MKKLANRLRWCVAVLLSTALFSTAGAEGRLVEEVVHSVALEGNLLGDSPDRSVTIYLPPGYNESPGRSYPVLYLLHGYTGTDKLWTGSGYLGSMNIQSIADRLIESGGVNPMLIVMPDAMNKYLGSMYTNSPVTGNWEDFVVQEVVAFVDANYRTLDRAESRGIAGHSMGGYGALMLAMKHPEVYQAVYGMSACCLGFVDLESSWTMGSAAWSPTLELTSADQFGGAGFASQVQIAAAAAWSPNPDGSPFFADFLFTVDGEGTRMVDSVWDRWQEHMPIAMIDRFGANLSQYRAVRFDVGRSDGFPHIPTDSRAFSKALTAAGIDHIFEEYDGTHTDRIPERLESELLPFFSRILQGQEAPTAVEAASWGRIKADVMKP